MKTVTFYLTTMQPLLMTSLQGDPNSSVSFPYIPGSVIRGALIKHYCQETGTDLELEDPHIQRWFFDGSTRYLHAYPLIDGLRAIPIPRTLAAEKTDEWENDLLKVYDFSEVQPDSIPLRSLTGFIARDRQGNLHYTTTRMLVNIHNQRDRPHGRGIDGNGAVFRYEAIAPDQTFTAAIICDDQDATMIHNWLPERLWIGGSRSAGYGEVRIYAKKIVDGWSEVVPLAPATTSDDEDDNAQASPANLPHLTITLTSDMIIRGTNGAYTTEPPDAQLGKLLSINIKPDKLRTSIATTLQGGFNRKWGLPLPQTPALAAGSVLSYTYDIPPSDAALAKLAADGLGERRAEGFGRVVCNLLPVTRTHTLYRWSLEKQTLAIESDLNTQALDDESQKLAKVMAQRILEQRLETRLIEQTQTHQISCSISNTQLSRLRIIARRALGSGTIDSIEQFLDHLPANASNQFAHARVGSQSLDSWIRQHLVPIPTEWNSDQLKVSIADVTLEPNLKMQIDFTLRLLMAMARLKVKGDAHE
jgi:CRISPR-associated protein Csx10